MVYGEEDEEKEERDDRRSYEGWYLVRNKLPLNPCGRTGKRGYLSVMMEWEHMNLLRFVTVPITFTIHLLKL